MQGDVGRIMVVLLTDGRANISLARSNDEPDAMEIKPSQVQHCAYSAPAIPVMFLCLPSCMLQEELRKEVLDMAKRLGAANMQLLVIDTENKFVSTGFAKEIAVQLCHHLYCCYCRLCP